MRAKKLLQRERIRGGQFKIDVNRQHLSQQTLGFRHIAPLDRQRSDGHQRGRDQ